MIFYFILCFTWGVATLGTNMDWLFQQLTRLQGALAPAAKQFHRKLTIQLIPLLISAHFIDASIVCFGHPRFSFTTCFTMLHQYVQHIVFLQWHKLSFFYFFLLHLTQGAVRIWGWRHPSISRVHRRLA